MFIGKEGEFIPGVTSPLQKKKQEPLWMVVLQHPRGDPVSGISGMRCTLARLPQIALTLQESETCVREKILKLAHDDKLVVLKTGLQEDMELLGGVLGNYICHCNFVLNVAPAF